MTLLLVGVLTLTSNIQPVNASDTIYIRADGSVDPSWAPIARDGSVYTFTNNINDSIEVQRSNIILDGNGYALQGTGTGTGLYLTSLGLTNVTVRNTAIRDFEYGIFAFRSSFNTLSGNYLAANDYSIYLYYSLNNSVTGNNITTSEKGIWFDSSSSSNITENSITANSGYGIAFLNASNNRISHNTIRNGAGISVGIYLGNSSGNSVSENNVTTNNDGISLSFSTNTSILENNVTGNNNNGIALSSSSGNENSGNTLTANHVGIYLLSSSFDNDISGNNVTANDSGILLYSSCSTNNIYGNSISGNGLGIISWSSPGNFIFHNNFVDNSTPFLLINSAANAWDDGYPSGGNYWSNYYGIDVYRGTGQNINGPDGIGDIPYVLGTNNTDRYPLMSPIGSSTATGENVTVFPVDDVCIIFESVTINGSTTVDKNGTGPDPPLGYTIDQYYSIETTAEYSGTIRIRITYDDTNMTGEEESNLQLMQHITIPWDLDGDYDVDIYDAVKLLVRYGVKEGETGYDPDCDIDKDGRIFLYDAVILCSHYGQELEPSERWQDVTVQIDTENNLIFAETTHLSIFGVTRG